jgi:hypothetical protein
MLQLHYFALNKPPGYICSNVSHNAPGKRAADLLQPWVEDWQRQHKVRAVQCADRHMCQLNLQAARRVVLACWLCLAAHVMQHCNV